MNAEGEQAAIRADAKAANDGDPPFAGTVAFVTTQRALTEAVYAAANIHPSLGKEIAEYEGMLPGSVSPEGARTMALNDHYGRLAAAHRTDPQGVDGRQFDRLRLVREAALKEAEERLERQFIRR